MIHCGAIYHTYINQADPYADAASLAPRSLVLHVFLRTNSRWASVLASVLDEARWLTS